MKSKNLRKGFDYIGITCVFICHDGKGNILMHKRSKNCRDEIGCWDAGGGALEFGETFEEGVKREIKEEYCSDVINLKFLGPHNIIREHNREKTHWVALLFMAQVDPTQVKIGEPKSMDEIGWFSEDNLPTPLHSAFLPFFKIVKSKLKS